MAWSFCQIAITMKKFWSKPTYPNKSMLQHFLEIKVAYSSAIRQDLVLH